MPTRSEREQRARDAVVRAAMAWAQADKQKHIVGMVVTESYLIEECARLAKIQKEKKRAR